MKLPGVDLPGVDLPVEELVERRSLLSSDTTACASQTSSAASEGSDGDGHVWFNSPMNESFVITPYSGVYGMHPRFFHFGKDGEKLATDAEIKRREASRVVCVSTPANRSSGMAGLVISAPLVGNPYFDGQRRSSKISFGT